MNVLTISYHQNISTITFHPSFNFLQQRRRLQRPKQYRCNLGTMASSATSSTPNNFSVKAIPGAFALALVPHSYYLIRLMSATRGQLSFAM